MLKNGLVPIAVRANADLVTCDAADVLIEHGFIRAIEPVGLITRSDVEMIEGC